MKKIAEKRSRWIALDHGEYSEIPSEKDFFSVVKASDRVVCHFYRKNWPCKETDIGRHVNQLRKNPSNDVKRLVKQLVRKWKELVDEWVSRDPLENTASNLIADGDSPQQNIPRNRQYGHHQVPDFAYSPNPHSKHRINGHLLMM